MRRFLLVSAVVAIAAAGPVAYAGAPVKAKTPPPVATVPVAPPPDPLATPPVIGAPTPFKAPVPDAVTLSNGASVWVVPRPGLPLVSLVLHVAGGSALDPVGHEGAASLSDRLMTQGAGALTAAQFAETTERLGIQIEVSTDEDGSEIVASMKKDQLPVALGLIADMVLRPHWGTGDYKRERTLAIGELTQGQEDPPTAAEEAAPALWYGATHPWGHPPEGTVKGMGAVTVKDVQKYHAQVWNSASATITMAGDVTTAEAQGLLEAALGAPWAAAKSAAVPIPAAPVATDRPVYLIDSPGAAQTMFYLTFPGRAEDDARLPALRAGTIALAGSFTSRLNGLLREKLGYTYGVHAEVLPMKGQGTVVINSRIRTDVTGDAMKQLLDQLNLAESGITAAELQKAQGAFRQDKVEAMEGCAGIAETFAWYHAAGFAPDHLAGTLVAMDAVTTDAVKAEMTAYDVHHALIVLVGDKAKVADGLKAAGIANVEVIEPK